MFIFYNLFLKFFLTLNLISFSVFSLFISDPFMIWFFMEINNFMFMCLLSLKIFNKKMIFLYFLIQTTSSLLLIFSLMLNFYFLNKIFFKFLFLLTLMMKLGIPPFHMWMPLISMYMNWDILYLMLSIQKLIPLYLMSIMEINPLILHLLILSSSYFSMFKMINLMNNFKIIMTLSSINQTSWMLFLILFKNLFWLLYFILYSMILMIIHMIFLYLKFTPNFSINLPSNIQVMFMFMFFNIASLPPFSFFFMKWMSLYYFLSNSLYFFIFILMLLNSLILIYIYLNISLSLMFFYSINLKLMKMNPLKMTPLKKLPTIMLISLFFSLSLILI